uniref:Uncharacterized protein n=1 Tax=Hyaloperonospora arabidopsidis (strain Emoy2) TaxID=559515 RepID=M4BAX8_HYAAE
MLRRKCSYCESLRSAITHVPLVTQVADYLLRARRVRKVECRAFKSYLSVCVSVNNAGRCSLHVLSAIKPVPFS